MLTRFGEPLCPRQVIGSGIAGLSYALQVAEHGTVAVLTKDEAQEGSTRYAQVRQLTSALYRLDV
jgi:aspartate oxidase